MWLEEQEKRSLKRLGNDLVIIVEIKNFRSSIYEF
jgi:hypothetical protein